MEAQKLVLLGEKKRKKGEKKERGRKKSGWRRVGEGDRTGDGTGEAQHIADRHMVLGPRPRGGSTRGAAEEQLRGLLGPVDTGGLRVGP